MEQALYNIRTHHYLDSSLFFKFCGFSKTMPYHSFGPAIRDNYILHLVLDGQGMYSIKNHQYFLKKGDFFIIPPGESTFYTADATNPWTYAWIAFGGSTAQQFIELSPFMNECYVASTLTMDPYVTILQECLQFAQDTLSDELKLTELTYRFLRTFILDAQKISIPIARKTANLTLQVIQYIQANYHQPISVQQMANDLSVNRSHLSRQFKKDMHTSIQLWLLGIRINQAAFLLTNTNFSIERIGEEVGFKSLVSFSRAFKQQLDESPSAYRKKQLTTDFTIANFSTLFQTIEKQNLTSRAT